MKTNTMMRVASVLLVAVLLSTCAIAGTYAKYVSTTTGSDSARVAKWDIKLNSAAMTESFTFDLFKTIKDSDGNAETDIDPTDGTVIAPGTQGSFDIVLKNDSEVTAKYGINYTVTNTANIPVEFSVDDGATWTTDLADVTAGDATKLAAKTGTDTITVQWRWAFERGTTDEEKNTNNTADTTLGLAGTAVLSVQAVITVEQVD